MKETLACKIANTIMSGFERHIELFVEITQSAQERFQLCQWNEVHRSARARTTFYDDRVEEAYAAIKNDFNIDQLNNARVAVLAAILGVGYGCTIYRYFQSPLLSSKILGGLHCAHLGIIGIMAVKAYLLSKKHHLGLLLNSNQ